MLALAAASMLLFQQQLTSLQLSGYNIANPPPASDPRLTSMKDATEVVMWSCYYASMRYGKRDAERCDALGDHRVLLIEVGVCMTSKIGENMQWAHCKDVFKD